MIGNLPFESKSPLWYIRLTHTRLADSILELCGVPSKEPVRRICLHMLSRLTSPPPSCLARFVPVLRRKRSNSRQIDGTKEEILEKFLNDLVISHGVEPFAIDNLRKFFNICKPNSWHLRNHSNAGTSAGTPPIFSAPSAPTQGLLLRLALRWSDNTLSLTSA